MKLLIYSLPVTRSLIYGRCTLFLNRKIIGVLQLMMLIYLCQLIIHLIIHWNARNCCTCSKVYIMKVIIKRLHLIIMDMKILHRLERNSI